MSDNDNKSKKTLSEIVKDLSSSRLGSLIAEMNQSSFYKIADAFNNSDYLKSVRSAGLLEVSPQLTDALSVLSKIELGYVDSLKLLGEYGRTHPMSALAYDNGDLSSTLRALANDDAMKNQLSYLSQSVKEMTSITKAYNFNFPLFESGLFDSLLFKYMSSDIRNILYVEGAESLEYGSAVGSSELNYDFVEIDPLLDAEIVQELEKGGDFSTLSFRAKQYLNKWWPILLIVFDLISHFITFDQYYEEKMKSAKSASEIKAVVGSMPREHREMLEGQSVVIRESVILRAMPDTQSKELGRMKLGTRIDVESVRGSWVYVSVDINGEEMKGWVYQQFTLKL